MTNYDLHDYSRLERAYEALQSSEGALVGQIAELQGRLKLVRTSLSKLRALLPSSTVQAAGAQSLLAQLEQMLREASAGLTRAEIIDRLAGSPHARRSVNLGGLVSNRLSHYPGRFVRDAATRRWFHVDCVREPRPAALLDAGPHERCDARPASWSLSHDQ